LIALDSLKNITKIPELKLRILFTCGMLAICRIGTHFPTPGINGDQLSKYLHESAGSIMGFFDLFSGGALSQAAIFALGIMPYISASIILQLLTVVFPKLAELKKEGERGNRKISQYTRYGTVGISLIQAFMIAVALEGIEGGSFVTNPGWGFRLMTMITMTTGTVFLMWLGEQITERGIGNGISLIIFANIVARFPSAILRTGRLVQVGEMQIFTIILILVVMVAVIAAIVFIERGQRRIPVQYARRSSGGRQVFGGQSSHIPLKVNTAGVIPPIFASSLMMIPSQIPAFFKDASGSKAMEIFNAVVGYGTPGYFAMYVGLIIFFAFFYTAVVFNPVDVADNMKKYGGSIPGIRPGKETSDYIYKVLNRVTFGGAIYLAIVCVIPDFLKIKLQTPFYFGGTSLLIVVGVALDTVSQIETHLITRHYEGFMKGVRLKGRRG